MKQQSERFIIENKLDNLSYAIWKLSRGTASICGDIDAAILRRASLSDLYTLKDTAKTVFSSLKSK